MNTDSLTAAKPVPHFIPPAHTYVLEDTHGNRQLFGAQDDLIAGAHHFMQLVLKTRMEPFELDRRFRLCLTPLGDHLDDLAAYSEVYAPDRWFEPQLKLFLEEYREHPFSKSARMPLQDPEYRSAAIDFIRCLRNKARTEGIRRLQADWESKYLKNGRRVVKLERRCFAQCASVQIVFLHLYLSGWVRSSEQVNAHLKEQHLATLAAARQYKVAKELAWKVTPSSVVSFEDFQKARQRFFANAKGRTSVFKPLLAHAWRTPFAPDAGYHMHGVFFFDAAKVEDAQTVVDGIGGFWSDMTDGRGRLLPGGLECLTNGGVIDRDDFERRARLRRELLDPMTRSEYVTAPLPRGANVFGSSWLPPPKPDANHRPKRKKSMSKFVLPQEDQGLTPKPLKKKSTVVGGDGVQSRGKGMPW